VPGKGSKLAPLSAVLEICNNRMMPAYRAADCQKVRGLFHKSRSLASMRASYARAPAPPGSGLEADDVDDGVDIDG
jgi:hypothetical protein